jgi:hypothetical protein
MRYTAGLALVLVLSACGGPSLEALTQSADALAVPVDWELVDERSSGPDCPNPVENCPSVERAYRVPGDVDFGDVFQDLFEDAGFDVWDPAAARCGANPEQGCNAAARRDDVSLLAVVTEATGGSYTVTVRASEYVGP